MPGLCAARTKSVRRYTEPLLPRPTRPPEPPPSRFPDAMRAAPPSRATCGPCPLEESVGFVPETFLAVARWMLAVISSSYRIRDDPSPLAVSSVLPPLE